VEAALADDANGLSQRDRAIGCVLLFTGLRPSDVAALRCDEIDWDRDTIRLTQQKTGVPLELPLLPCVGNAIFDYATGDRGGGSDPHVFLSETWPHGGMSPKGVVHVACAVLDAAGIRQGEGDRRGARIFRAGVATSMMSDGADRAVISAALGHDDPRSTERYMGADVEGLRRRALDVSRFPLGEGALA
jgi:integrase